MNPFTKTLTAFLNKKNISVETLASFCRCDFALLDAIIAGKQSPPSLDFVKKLGHSLNLSPQEINDLSVSYYKSLLGERVYENFQNILDFLLTFNPSASLKNFSPIRYEPASKDDATVALKSSVEITQAFYHVIFHALSANKKVMLILQPATDVLNTFFTDLMASLDLEVTHILCLSDADALGHNVKCLKQSIAFLSSLKSYNALYYYDNAQARFENHALHPFLLLTETHAISFSSGFDSGIYYADAAIVALYHKQADILLDRCQPLYQIFRGLVNEQHAFNALTGNFLSIESEPCFFAFISKELLDNVLDKKMPHRGERIQALEHYFGQQKNSFLQGRASSYFSLEGLRFFAQTGRITAVDDALYRPFLPAERLEILTGMLPFIKKNQYKILKRALSSLDRRFHLSLHKDALAIALKSKDDQLFVAVLNESPLISYFEKFVDCLIPYDYLYSTEEALAFFEAEIETLQRKL